MPVSARPLHAIVVALLVSACGAGASNLDGGGPIADAGLARDGGGTTVRDGGPTADAGVSCADPCRCADRGPPDFSGESTGRPAASSDNDQRAALRRANRWRTAAGLAPLHAHSQLEQSATAHASYLATNPEAQCWSNAHSETSTCMGFTGVSAGPRAAAAGYRYRLVTEVIDWRPTVDDAVDTWLWTVYHRRSFFNPVLLDVGYARRSGPYRNRTEFHNVMNFGQPQSGTPSLPAEPAVFPVPGQSDVPLAFDGARESPRPEAPPRGWPSGAVVSAHPPGAGFTVTAHKLFRASGGSCTEVAHRFITRGNDANLEQRESDEVFLYADEPLAPSTEYVVRLEGTWAGRPYARTWSFTTARQ